MKSGRPPGNSQEKTQPVLFGGFKGSLDTDRSPASLYAKSAVTGLPPRYGIPANSLRQLVFHAKSRTVFWLALAPIPQRDSQSCELEDWKILTKGAQVIKPDWQSQCHNRPKTHSDKLPARYQKTKSAPAKEKATPTIDPRITDCASEKSFH